MNNTYAIATDYDGTIADSGRVHSRTVAALERFRAAGHFLIMVTGREIDDLRRIFPEHAVFHQIVAENGAILYDCDTRVETLLAAAPPPGFIESLRNEKIGPLYIGRVIIATIEEHQHAIARIIESENAPLELILNKDAVMVLPRGVTKASGLRVALDRLGLSREQVAGVGDAENDIDLLAASGFGVAVQNALPSLKERADWVTDANSGDGMVQLVNQILTSGLQAPSGRR